MKPSVSFSLHRAAMRAAAARFHTANPRVFGGQVFEHLRLLRYPRNEQYAEHHMGL